MNWKHERFSVWGEPRGWFIIREDRVYRYRCDNETDAKILAHVLSHVDDEAWNEALKEAVYD